MTTDIITTDKDNLLILSFYPVFHYLSREAQGNWQQYNIKQPTHPKKTHKMSKYNS